MTENKSARQIYMENKGKVHEASEFIEAFDENVVVCFALKRERHVTAKSELLGNIWKIAPEAIITDKCDLCVMFSEPNAYVKQFLLIFKNTGSAEINAALDLIAESEVIEHAYLAYPKKTRKSCIKLDITKTTFVVRKMNLLLDGNNLMITVRHLSQVNRKAKETSET